MKQQITTVSFFKYATWSKKFWALAQMQLAIGPLLKIPGLTFFKLMGSGAGAGFSLKPDFSTYCLLAVWETAADADAFFSQNPSYAAFARQSIEQWTLYLRATRAKGLWSGLQPFECHPELAKDGLFIALTRASINWNRLTEFWRHVPLSSQAIEQAEGVLFSKGVGELPLIQQATISIWESPAAMRRFAYENGIHQEIIRKTKTRKWYSEELFASFALIKSTGTPAALAEIL